MQTLIHVHKNSNGTEWSVVICSGVCSTQCLLMFLTFAIGSEHQGHRPTTTALNESLHIYSTL